MCINFMLPFNILYYLHQGGKRKYRNSSSHLSLSALFPILTIAAGKCYPSIVMSPWNSPTVQSSPLDNDTMSSSP